MRTPIPVATYMAKVTRTRETYRTLDHPGDLGHTSIQLPRGEYYIDQPRTQTEAGLQAPRLFDSIDGPTTGTDKLSGERAPLMGVSRSRSTSDTGRLGQGGDSVDDVDDLSDYAGESVPWYRRPSPWW